MTSGPALVSAHDAVLLDLDGVVYVGPVAVPGAAEAIERLRGEGLRVAFVTNNASRSPQAVAGHLSELGVTAVAEDVVTSAQAAARLLADRLPAGASVMVVGTEALRAEVLALGLRIVPGPEDEPRGVIQGYDPELVWSRLNETAHAVQGGALWVATNTDSNRPTDRGLVPGHGTAVAAVRAAVEVEPLVAGKPSPPLLAETVRRTGSTRPIFVGDRLDTDVAGAQAAGMASALVLTGSHGKVELLRAEARHRPDHLLADLSGLLGPAAEVVIDGAAGQEGARARCGDVEVRLVGGRLEVSGTLAADQQLAAVWAGAQLAWSAADADGSPDPGPLLAATPDVP